MFGLNTLQAIEARGTRTRAEGAEGAQGEVLGRVILLFFIVVVGILANWFWGVGWDYLADPSKGLQLGPPLAVIVRVVLSFIAAALTFVPIYNKVNQGSRESWVPAVLAFQNGFFWKALFDGITKSFTG